MIKHKIYLAPLQGYTISDYRNLHHQYFGGVDKYFSPYLRFEPNKELRKSVLRDLVPENNEEINFVPQVLGKDIPMFIDLAKQMESWGYQEMNWNLGCPYPMVTNRGFGSALLQTPDKIKEILDSVFSQITIPLSIKCRLGFDNFEDIHGLIELFNQYPIKELTIHTRNAKQMYKGKANPDAFVPLIQQSKNSLVYNGDINNKADVLNHDNLFDGRVNAYMIGRGLLLNPFLASGIKGGVYTDERKR